MAAIPEVVVTVEARRLRFLRLWSGVFLFSETLRQSFVTRWLGGSECSKHFSRNASEGNGWSWVRWRAMLHHEDKGYAGCPRKSR